MEKALFRGSLTQALISDFSKQVTENEEIIIYQNEQVIATTNKASFTKIFLVECANVLTNALITISANSAVLEVSYEDYVWWNKTSKRVEKFESCFTSNPVAKVKKTKAVEETSTEYSVGVAVLIEGELSNISHKTGSKQECIDFINNEMICKYVEKTLNAKLVINLCFDVDEFNAVFSDTSTEEQKFEYKHKLDFWYTIEELTEMGAIVIS